MPKPLCVKCQIEYRPERNDIRVEEMASFGSYRLWCADLWECPVCHHQIITGYGKDAYAEHWQEDYRHLLSKSKEYGLFRCYENPDSIPEDVQIRFTGCSRADYAYAEKVSHNPSTTRICGNH